MAITPNDYASTAGIPAQWSEDFGVTGEGFIVGDTPAVVTEDLVFATGQTLAARTAVGFDNDGNLVAATATIQAIGFTVVAVTTTTATAAAPVYRAGVFNPDLAVWDATFTTAAQKLAAFHGAPTPTNIILRAPKTATPVLP